MDPNNPLFFLCHFLRLAFSYFNFHSFLCIFKVTFSNHISPDSFHSVPSWSCCSFIFLPWNSLSHSFFTSQFFTCPQPVPLRYFNICPTDQSEKLDCQLFSSLRLNSPYAISLAQSASRPVYCKCSTLQILNMLANIVNAF